MQLVLSLGVSMFCLLLTEATIPRITLYSGPDQTGESATYLWSVRDLLSWQRKARSACLTGFWVFFSSTDFAMDSNIKLRTVGSGCLNLADHQLDKAVRSVRLVGDPNDVSGRSLSLFEGEFYSGDMTYLAGATPSIPNGGNFSSAAVSGNQQWSIFSKDRYAGTEFCLNVHTEYSPVYGWFDRPSDMGPASGGVRSAEPGCPSANGLLLRNSEPFSIAVSYKEQ